MSIKRCAFVYWPGMKKEFEKVKMEMDEGEIEKTVMRHSLKLPLSEFISEAMAFANSLENKLISISEYTYPKSRWFGNDRVLCIVVYYRT